MDQFVQEILRQGHPTSGVQNDYPVGSLSVTLLSTQRGKNHPKTLYLEKLLDGKKLLRQRVTPGRWPSRPGAGSPESW
jgi:hypothetical protein